MANRFQSLIDGKEENKISAMDVSSSNGNRFSGLLEQPTSQVSNKQMFDFIPAHTSTQTIKQDQEPNFKTAFVKGTLGSLVGKALTPLAEKIAGKQVDLTTLPESNTLGQKAIEAGSNLITDLPLWLAGDAALTKPLAALSKTAPVAKALSYVQKAIAPALGTGVRVGATYGGVIAPAETAIQGDGLQGLIDREKQVPLMALGGVALHGAGQLAGKGIGEVQNALLDRSLKYPELPSNPLQDIQNAYRTPSLRDVKTQQYNDLFNSGAKPLVTEQRISIRNPLKTQGMTDTELLSQKQLDARSVFGDPLNNYRLKGIITPEQRAYDLRQAELNDAFRNQSFGSSVDAPLTTNTLQQNIDNSLGIGKPREDYTGLDAFGKPLNTLKKNTETQDAITELTARMTKQANEVTKTLKQIDSQTPIATTRSKIQKMGGIKPSKGDLFEEQQTIPSWIKNEKGRPLDEVADTLGMTSEELRAVISSEAFKPKDYVAETFKVLKNDLEYQANSELLETLKAQIPGSKTLKAMPKLKPRELTSKPEVLPIQPPRLELSGNLPVDSPIQLQIKPDIPLKPRTINGPQPMESILTQRVLPEKPAPLTWTNKDSISSLDNQTPIGSITEQRKLTDEKLNPPLRELAENIPDAKTVPVSERIISKLDDIEAAARARIASNKGRLNAGLPVDTMIDYGIIGGVKIAKGVVKYSVWANEMVSDLGNSVRPHLKEIWQEANKQHSLMVDGTFDHSLPEPQSKIIIGKKNDSLSFKDAWNKFYTGIVDSQKPIGDFSKVASDDTSKLASNTKSVGGIVDHNFLKAMVDKEGNKVGGSLKSVVESIPKGKEEDFWTYMSQRHNIDRAREGKPVQANYTPSMSTEAVKAAEQTHPEYKAIGDGIVNWLDKFMQTWGVDTGIVNMDLYAGLRETYKSYFPTQRDFSELEKAIPDNVSQKFADQRTPIRKATGSERDIIDPVENIMQLVNRTVRTAKYNEVGQSLLDSVRAQPEKLKPLAEVIPTKDGMFANTDNIITVLEYGKPTYLKINNKPLLDAMNGLPKSIGNIPVLSTLTNTFKSLITQKNPIFAIRNISRDIPTAYVNGSESNPFKFGKGLIGAGKDILTNSPRLQRYQAVGGGGANFFNSGDVTKSAAELMGKGNPVKKLALKPIHAIEAFNNLTEAAPRLAEFNRVYEKTGDITKALAASNDATVNFSRGGNITKSVDKVVPYLNAGVQGLDRFVRSFANPKTAISTIVKSGVAITAPDLALYLINKDDPNYQALDNRTKDTYFLIPKGDGTFVKIPKSRELGVLFGSLFERGLRSANGQPNSFKGFGNSVATNFAPANPIDSNFFSPATWNIATNKDFAGRAIVPQSMIMDKRSKYLQYDDKTSSIAKEIGKLSSNVIDGGLSPKQLDYLIKSYTGVIGQLGIPLTTPGGSPGKTISSQFVSDPLFSNQATTDFYDKLDKLSSAATDKNIIDKIPSKKLTPEEDMRNSMNGISSALTRGTKLINSIQSSSDPQKDDKIRTIKTKMLSLTSKAVSADTPRKMQSIEDSSKKLFLK